MNKKFERSDHHYEVSFSFLGGQKPVQSQQNKVSTAFK